MAVDSVPPAPNSGNPDNAFSGDGGIAAGEAYSHAGPEERGPMLKGMIESAVYRLADIVDEETDVLRRGGQADFKSYNSRKSLGFMELSRALRLLDGGKPDPATAGLLKDLGAKLEANRNILKLHLDAVGEVASIISRSIQEAESDGTYTLAFRSKEQKS
jgi:hypothetical protein